MASMASIQMVHLHPRHLDVSLYIQHMCRAFIHYCRSQNGGICTRESLQPSTPTLDLHIEAACGLKIVTLYPWQSASVVCLLGC